MTTLAQPPKCMLCKHFHMRDSSLDMNECDAFKKIPDKIWLEETDHEKPFPGDNDIQFEQKPNNPKPEDFD